ncbi:glycosyltransferase [Curtobacterium sp. MCLR17_058]|uniref:glycosyltransferase n=1 Tax=Curtobacterium sp. MCLR17_058 TaxID=2175635 RepID=UPI000DA8C681|nr:glycosyltransferase [Curtobacterium sp. MCLR17_058]WIB43280.1 glycosyltransferase [Curtobacterium sp. MCLR17_058]
MPGLIAHEWVAPHGGSENVAELMAETFPNADILALWNDAPSRFVGRRVRETWLSRSPMRRHKALALPFMSPTWAAIDLRRYDWALVSSHVFAHHLGDARRGSATTAKFVYVHTPARTIWAPEQDSRGASRLVRLAAPVFRTLDRSHVSQRVQYAANSNYIKARIRHVWGQDARVIYPPVNASDLLNAPADFTEAEQATLANLPDGYVLGASRFVPYKRLDLVMLAAAEVRRPVVIAGGGPEEGRLRELAARLKVPVQFIAWPRNPLLHELYRRASVFVFPAVEDFGIMPVEAMAAGVPVVVTSEGGARESVDLVDGGEIAEEAEVASFGRAINRAVSRDISSVPARVVSAFGRERFQREITEWIACADENLSLPGA